MRYKVALILLTTALSGCIPSQDYGPPLPPPGPEPLADGIPSAPPIRPVWEARPVVADATIIQSTTYTVQPGDTLRGIAQNLGASSELIARDNALPAPYTIRPGQRLRIAGGSYHLVKPGESGIAIARAYGVKWVDIVAANDLTEPYVLRTGRRLLIPGGRTSGAVGSQTLAERAASFRIDLGDIATGGGEPAIAEGDRPLVPAASTLRPVPSSTALGAPSSLGGAFLWPVTGGNVVKRFGSGGASGERNNGIKIAVPIGTPIKATADGVVIYTADAVPGLGGLVMLRHAQGWTSVYGHASRITVQRGQAVKRGQTIALSGDTGFADRPELHFELRNGRAPVDPMGQLPRR